MSNIKALEPNIRIAIDNDKERREYCAEVFARIAAEKQAINMFSIVILPNGETRFHSTIPHTADVIYLIEKFKYDLLAGKYDVQADDDAG
jgi:hypothetical protein